MKQIHKLLIGSFIGPFVLTFLISLFILVMQFLWLYIDDLMGKGLEWLIIAEFLLYACATLVNLALPMAVLLSSIMTFGNLAEQYELVAMKAAGISLLRIMFTLFFVILLLTAGAFCFANWISPVAYLKSRTLLWDITEKKPALELRPNVFFNGIEGYSIRIKNKDTEKNTLEDVLIYDHSDEYGGNRRVIRAKTGKMSKSTDGKSLVLNLYDGVNYEEMAKSSRAQSSFPQVTTRFKKQELRIELSGMNLRRSDENLFKQGHRMLNISQLDYVEDSLQRDLKKYEDDFADYLNRTLYISRDSTAVKVDTMRVSDNTALSKDILLPSMELAANSLRNAKSYTERQIEEDRIRREQYNRYAVEWHRKFTLALACTLLFFIGAPLGAIIRKGGLGMPVVFAVLFFLLFHVLSITGEKMAIAGLLPLKIGMWLNIIVLTPFAIFITQKANLDSPLFDRDTYFKLIRKFTRKKIAG